MNISLDRLFEGIMATLRADVIPHVAPDSYARGQAVGSHRRPERRRPPRRMGARASHPKRWARSGRCCGLSRRWPPNSPGRRPRRRRETLTSAALLEERDRLDARIGDALAVAYARKDEAARQALGLLIAHVHDELTREMKLTRKPLFAEIASGRDGEGDEKRGMRGVGERPQGEELMAHRIDPRMPPPEACVQRYMIERLAKAQPDVRCTQRISSTDRNGPSAQTLDIAVRTANARCVSSASNRASASSYGCPTAPTACASGSA